MPRGKGRERKMITDFIFSRKRILKTIPLFRGWKLIKEESDQEYIKRVAELKEIKLKWESGEGGDKRNN